MSIVSQITEDIKAAMKAKDRDTLDALRAAKSEFLLAATSKGAEGEVDDESAMKVLQKLLKQRMESAEMYAEQNREDLRADELRQAEVLSRYLPKPMNDADLEQEIASIVSETGASTMADMGKVMGMASKKLAGKADGKRISSFVRAALN
uniref:YqeY family protein n=1 Tax=uncultured Flavobacteriia bacterium TaxID=212695 RepID=H6RFV3_9BACT|nr:aspartyl-tRNA amidotransferase subunit B [uncultured bacterium]CCF99914.1 YqeY family protein [uncultured Flavobacteriia bacterium]